MSIFSTCTTQTCESCAARADCEKLTMGQSTSKGGNEFQDRIARTMTSYSDFQRHLNEANQWYVVSDKKLFTFLGLTCAISPRLADWNFDQE